MEVEVDKDHWKKNGKPIEAQWLRGPRELRPSYKYHMSQNENLYALTIKDLMFEDEGDYTFKVEGHETQCRLKIDEAPVVFTKPLSRVSAKEKDDVTLECEANKVKWKITGKDIDFTWKKGDGRLDETPKVKFDKQGRKLTLNLKKISMNDASEYSCNAGEGAMASKTIGGLEVQELPLGFDEGLKDIEKSEGETAILEAVINRPGADVTWFKDGNKIDFSDPRFEQKQDKDGRIQLIIKPCVMDDEATYEAKVGTKKTSGKLRVKEGPVCFTKPLADMSVKEGAPAVVHAVVNKLRYQQSGASVNITWYRNDIPISKYDDRVEVKNDELNLYCTVKKINMDDSGAKYSVTADTARTEGTLTVTEEPLYFVEKLKDTPLKKIPSTVTLSCKLNKPGVPVQWLKDGMPIKIDGDKYEVKEEDGKHFLIIHDCTGDDEGKYTCKAKDVTCDCAIQVKAAPTLDISDEVRTIKAGTGTVFEIPYSGHPVPTVTWTHKGAALEMKRRKADHIHGKMLKLSIKDSVRADSGAYNVVVENEHGKTDGIVKLNVLDIPGPPRDLRFREVFSDRIVVEWDMPSDDGGSPITGYIVEKKEKARSKFTEVGETDGTMFYSIDSGLKEDQEQEYVIRVAAINKFGIGNFVESKPVKAENPFKRPDPPQNPVVSDVDAASATLSYEPPLKDGGSPITGYIIERRHTESARWQRITKSATPHLKHIDSELVEGYEYEYRVFAENKAGLSDPSKPSNRFTCKDPYTRPGPPIKVEYAEVTKKFVKLTWKVPKSDGGAPIFNYVVEAREVGEIEWQILNLDEDCINTNFTCRGLKEGGTYEFRVSAENKAGIGGPASPPGPVRLKDQLKGKPPKIVEPTLDTTTVLGTQGILQARVVGDPKPDVIWYKGTDVISEGNQRYKLSYTGDRATLIVKDAVFKDEGYYTCEAVNALGRDECSSNVSITEKPKIVYDSKYDAGIEGRAKYNTKINTTVTGRPKPGVTWIKDGQPLKHGENDRFFYESVDNQQNLTINKAERKDTGKYRIEAENCVGKAHAEFDVNIMSVPTICGGPIEVLGVTNSTIDISWKKPADDGGTPLTGYVVEKRDARKATWTLALKVEPQHTMCTVPGLENRQAYFLRVRAENKLGEGPDLETKDPTMAKDPFDPPGPPSKPSSKDASTEFIDLTWNPPTDDGGSPIKGYTVQKRLTDAVDWAIVNDVPATKPFLHVTGVVANASYEFRVCALNAAGPGPYGPPSDPIKAKEPFDPPGPPGMPEILKVTKSTMSLAWDRPKTDGGTPITKYIIESRMHDKAYAHNFQWNYAVDPDITISDTSYLVVNLIPGMTYEFRIVAENKVGRGPPGPPSVPTKAEDIIVGTKPEISFIEEIRVVAGKPVAIEANVKGEPEPEVEWSRGGISLTSGFKYKTTYMNGRASLVLSETNEMDAGTYTIRARNALGKAERQVEVVVYTPPTIEYDYKWKRPVRITEGTAFDLPTIVGGFPYPSASWSIGGVKIKSGKDIKITKTDEGSRIYIEKIQRAHSGIFSIALTNIAGSCSANFDITVIGPPGKPKFVGPDTVTRDSCTITWSPPIDDGGDMLTGYVIEKKEETVSVWTEVAKVGAFFKMYTITSLTEGLKYSFRVSAVNSVGQGPPAMTKDPVLIKSPYELPGKPMGPLEVLNIFHDRVTLAWRPPKYTGGVALLGYIIEVCEVAIGKWFKVANVDANIFYYTCLNLVCDTEYRFRVMAVNSEGNSLPLESDVVTPRRAAEVPSPVSGCKVTKIQVDSCELTWIPPHYDGGSAIIGYVIEVFNRRTFTWNELTIVDASVSCHTITRLREGVEYLFRIKVRNAIGDSICFTMDSPVVPKRDITVPGIPTGPLNIDEILSEEVTISWGPSVWDGGAPIEHYIIEVKDKITNWTRAGKTRGNVTSFTVTNLLEGNDYWFCVKAENCVGYGTALERREPVIPKAPANRPSAPAGPLNFTGITATSVTVSWNKPGYDGGSAIQGYVIEKRCADESSWTKVRFVISDVTICVCDGLTEGVDYYFRVRAVNAIGHGDALTCPLPVAPKDPPKVPLPPNNLEAIKITPSSATLIFEPPFNDGGSLITHYVLEQKAVNKDWEDCGMTDNVDLKITISRLKEGRPYLFRVKAVNAVGQSFHCDILRPVIPRLPLEPPAPPRGPLKIKNFDKTFMTVEWSKPLFDGGEALTGYTIEIRDAARIDWVHVCDLSINIFTYTITGLIAGHSYYVNIRARNALGLGAPLEMDRPHLARSPFTKPGKPRGPIRVLDCTKSTVTIAWDHPEDDGGSAIMNYHIERRESNLVTWVPVMSVRGSINTTVVDLCPIDPVPCHLTEHKQYILAVYPENLEGLGEPLVSHAITPRRKPGECQPEDHAHHIHHDHSPTHFLQH